MLGALRAWLPRPVERGLRLLLRRYRTRMARRVIARRPARGSARRRYRATHKQVVFISEVPRVREAKLAYGLRRNGWQVVLLHGAPASYDIGRHFDGAIAFRDPDHAASEALRFSPVAYHVFSPAGGLPSAYLVNARPGPVIFDTTDLLET